MASRVVAVVPSPKPHSHEVAGPPPEASRKVTVTVGPVSHSHGSASVVNTPPASKAALGGVVTPPPPPPPEPDAATDVMPALTGKSDSAVTSTVPPRMLPGAA